MIGNETDNETLVDNETERTRKSFPESSVEPFLRFLSQESHTLKIVGIRQKWESGNQIEMIGKMNKRWLKNVS